MSPIVYLDAGHWLYVSSTDLVQRWNLVFGVFADTMMVMMDYA